MSPTEHIKRSASISTSGTSSTNPRIHSRSQSVQYASTSQNQSPSVAHSVSVSQPSEPTTPVAQSSPQPTTRTEEIKRRDRDWAPARSPLQKLEVTLKDISKEEKRARVEEAEMLLRQATAGRRSRQLSQVVRPTSKVIEKSRAEDSSPRPATLEEAGLTRNLSTKQRERLQQSAVIESKKPSPGRFSAEREGFDYEALEQSAKGKGEPIQQNTEAHALVKAGFDPQFSFDGGANQFMAAMDEDDDDDYAHMQLQKVAQPSANQFRTQKVTESTNRRAQASTSVASPLLTPGPVQRSNSRKLQKPIPRELSNNPGADNYPDQRAAQDRRAFSYENVPETDSFAPNAQPTATNRSIQALKGSNEGPAGLGLVNSSKETQAETLDSGTEEKKKRASVTFAVPPATPPPLDEWRAAAAVRLPADCFKLRPIDTGKAWWEGGGSGRRKRGQSISHDVSQSSSKAKSKSIFATIS